MNLCHFYQCTPGYNTAIKYRNYNIIENHIFGSNLSLYVILFILLDMGLITFFGIYNILYCFVVRQQI